MVTVSPDGTQDFTTIQAAIDYVTANPSDMEIAVYPGTYQENLLIEAHMIIRSVGDANNTIIDGSLGRSLGSTIVIRPETMSTHHPLVEIDGFSIKNGKGTDVVNNTITLPDGTHPTEKVGGGLFVYVNSPKINNSQFLDNGNNSTDKGGAVFAASDSDDIGILERDHYEVHPDLPPAAEPLDFSNNTFLGNDANRGHSVYIEGFDGTTTDLSAGYFDVYIESEDLSGSSEYWIKGIGSGFDESIGGGEIEAITGDVYVSPNGNDNLNTGLSWESPFQTINFALSQVYADSLNPATIHLAEGTYSPSSNGEQYQLQMISWVSLIGLGEELTTLDAKQTSRVLTFENVVGVTISSLTIQNGNANGGYLNSRGGGIYCYSSNTILDNVTIFGNSAIDGDQSLGGGMYCSNSNPTLTNVIIIGNSASIGGGLVLDQSNIPIFSNVIISGNSAIVGGGIAMNECSTFLTNMIIKDNWASYASGIYLERSNPTFTNFTITGNLTDYFGGGIILANSFPKLVNCILWNNSPQELYFIPYENENPSSILISYSDIQGGEFAIETNNNGTVNWLEGNIDTNPLFANTENGDFSFQDDSPCIDAGTAYFEYEGEVIIDMDDSEYFGSAPDMGAFEYEGDSLVGDITGDGLINILDVVALVNIVLTGGEYSSAGDINSDGANNVLDVVALVNIILND